MDSVENINGNLCTESTQICSARYYASHLWFCNSHTNINSTAVGCIFNDFNSFMRK